MTLIIGCINLNVPKVTYKMSTKEGIIFTPGSKEVTVDRSSLIGVPLEDYIKEKKKASRKTDSSNPKKGRKLQSRRKDRTRKESSKKSSRQDKRVSKKETSKAPTKKYIEIKRVPEATLHEILNSVGVDTEGYNLRLVATKKQ